MKHISIKRTLRSLLALALALVVPFNAVASTLTLPSALKTVAAQAFMDNTAVEEIVLPEGTKTIDSQAFAGCTALTRAVIPASVEYIAEDAFLGVTDALFIDAPADSYAAQWARAHGYATNEAEPPADPAELVEHAFWPVQYVNMDGVNWVADLEIQNYELREGEELLWTVERVDENEGNPGTVEADIVENRGLFAGLHMYNFTGDTGTMIWRVTVESSMGDFSLSRDYEIEVVELPEGEGFDVGVPEEVVYLNVGDTYRATADGLYFIGNVPEGAQTFFTVMSGELEGYPTLEYTDDGFEITISEPGRYSYLISGTINGLEIFKPVYLVVGSGVSEGTEIVLHQELHTIYAISNSDSDFYVGDAYLELPLQLPGEDVSWSTEQISGDEALTLIPSDPYGDGFGINIHGHATSNASGEYTFLLKATTSRGLTVSVPVTITVTEAPADLPTFLSKPLDTYHLLPGEYIYFGYADIEFGDGAVPEDAVFSVAYHGTDELGQYGDVVWMEYGFEVCFDQEGVYTFEALAWLNNVGYSKLITLVVSDGEDEPCIYADQAISKVYTNGSHDFHLGTCYVESYEPQDGEEVSHWAIEYVPNGMDSPLTIDVQPIGIGLAADIHGTLEESVTGDFTYIIELVTNRRVLSTELTVTVADPTDDMPTAIALPQANYSVQLGETISFANSDIQFADGAVPADANLSRFFDPEWVEALNQYGEANLYDDGFDVTFHTDGSYSVLAVAWIDNIFYTKEIHITAGTGVSGTAAVRVYDPRTTSYIGGEDSMFAGLVEVMNYRMQEGDWYEWYIDPVDNSVSAPVLLMVEDEFDGGHCINLTAYNIGGDSGTETGTVTYRIIFATENDLIPYSELSTELTLTVENLPETIPTAITVPHTEYTLEAGDSLELTYDQITPADGVLPENASIDYHYWNTHTLPSCEWTQDGFVAQFDADGSYSVEAVLRINNYVVTQPIRIIVGDPMANVSIVPELRFTTMYLDEYSSAYLGSFTLENYTPMSSSECRWTLTRLGDDPNPPAIVEVWDTWGNGRYVNLGAYTTDGHEGSVTYRLTCTTAAGAVYTDFTINVEAKPDDLPTALVLPANSYHLEIGDSLKLYYSDIVAANGTIPVDAVVSKDYGFGNYIEGSIWYYDHLQINAQKDGRYMLYALLYINNITIRQEIVITIGTGIPTDVSLYGRMNYTKLYIDGYTSSYAGWFTLDNYRIANDEQYEWKLELLGDNPNPPVRLRITDEYDEGNAVDIGCYSLTGQTGSVTYRLTFTSETGAKASTDITMEVVAMPENLPTDVNLPATQYQIEPGESLFLAYADIVPVGGELPEDADVSYDYWTHDNDGNVQWSEDGLTVSYADDGRYMLSACIRINNYEITKYIVVTVGTGVSQNACIESYQRMDTLWLGYDENVFLGSFQLDGYRLADGEEHQWSIAPLTSGQSSILSIWGEYDSGNSVDIGAAIPKTTMEPTTYRLTFKSGDVELTKDITIAVTQAPDNLPTALTVPETSYQLEAGDSLTLLYEDIAIADGVIPDDAFVLWDYAFAWNIADSYWFEDGVTLTFNNNGRYQVEARLEINNCVITQPIIVTVGDGVPQNVTLESEQYIHTAYTDVSRSFSIGSFHLDGYSPMGSEDYEWKLDCLTDPESDPAKMVIFGEWGNGVSVGLYDLNGKTGTVSYRLTFSADGVEASTDITVDIVEKPGNLPDHISVPVTEYTLDAGATLTLRYDDIQFENGVIPEDAWVITDYATSDNESYSTRWLDDGVALSFPVNGLFQIEAIGNINNHQLAQPITIRVGTGYSDNAAMTWSQEIHTIYTDAGEEFPWIGSAMLEGYNVFDGDSVEWQLERIDGGSSAPVDMYMSVYDQTYAEVFFSDVRETGSVTYRLTAVAETGFTDSCEFTLTVTEKPDHLPTDIHLQTFYQLDPGDWMSFAYSDVGFADGEVPEGADTRVLLVNFDDIERHGDIEWDEDAFSVRFAQEGRYEFTVVKLIGNYALAKDVVIQVGEAAEPELSVWREYDTHYISENVHWLCDAHLENLSFEEDGHVEWRITCTDEEPLADLFVEPVWNNGCGAGFRMTNFTGKTGVLNYTIEAVVDGELCLGYAGNIAIQAAPDNLPSDIALESQIQVELGKAFTILPEDVFFTQDGVVPEEATVFTEFYVTEELFDHPGFEWKEGGFTVTFDENGRYLFTAASSINGIDYTKDVVLVAGTGVSDTMRLHVTKPFATHYIQEDHEQWLTDVDLLDHHLYDPDDVIWKIECLDEEPLAEAYVSDVWNDQRSAGFRIHSFTGKTGSFNYRISLYANGELLLTHEDCVQLAQMPDNLPSGVQLPYERAWIEVGATFVEYTNQISFTDDGVIPEDADVFFEFYTYEFDWMDGFKWLDNGFEMTFTENGRYPLYAVGSINGVEFITEIPLSVGQGYSDDARVLSNQYFVNLYSVENSDDEVVVGEVYLGSHYLFENEQVQWELKRTDTNSVTPLTLSIRPSEVFADHAFVYASNFTGETCAVTYEVTAYAPSGFTGSCELFFRVMAAPENLPTQLLLTDDYQDEMHFEVGDEFIVNEYDFSFSDDGVIPEDATIFYDIYENTRSVFWDQDIGWGVNGGFAVWFQREGRYELPLAVIINGYRLSRTLHITVGDGVNDDVHIALDHQINPIYLGGDELIVGTISVQEYNLFEGEYIQWEYTPVGAGDAEVPLLSIDEEGYWDGRYGIRVTDFNEAGETVYLITATLPTGEVLEQEFVLTVLPMPENLPTEISVPEESYTLFGDEELTLYLDEFGFANGEIPEDAHVEFEVWDFHWPESENEEPLPMGWFRDGEGREGVTIKADVPGSYAFYVIGQIANYRIFRRVPVTYVQGGSIAILTTSAEEDVESLAGALIAAETYGFDRVVIENYPEDYFNNASANADIIERLAENANVEAIIVSPAAPGTAEGMRRVAEKREDVLLIAGSPMEDYAEIAAAADFVLTNDDTAQADPLVEKCVEWDVDVLVHFSFPRHMQVERIKERHDRMAELAEAAGIQLIDATFPDTMEGGLELSREAIIAQTYALAEEYSDQKIAFFATNCGVQSALQSAVLELENAYYPQPCCPGPFHGFGETLELDFDMDDPEDALHQIANALYARGAEGRFSTWAAPMNLGIVQVAAEYGMAFAEDRIEQRCDMELVGEMFASSFGGADVSANDYDNLFSIVMSPVNFKDYVTSFIPKIAIVTASGVLNAEDYASAMHIQETYGKNRVIVETYPNDFLNETDETVAKIAALAAEPDVKAIIVSQAVPGTVEGFEAAREVDPDVLLIACAPQEDYADVVSAADFVLHANEGGQARAIMDKLVEWGVDTLVHYSFPRHMELDEVVTRLNGLKALAEDNGIEILEVQIPDPLDDFDNARTTIAEMTHSMASSNADKKIAFFATNCGMQYPLQEAVLEHENAYYPLPCCPSPFHGFAELVGELDLTDPHGSLTVVANELAKYGAEDRFSTWAAPINMGMAETAAAYALAYADGEITDRSSHGILYELLTEQFEGAEIDNPDFNNLFAVRLSCIDFEDYATSHPRSIHLWVAGSIGGLTQQQFLDFKAENPEYADWKITFDYVSEGDAATLILEGDTSADLFVFAQDQLARLATTDHLSAVSEENAQLICEEHDEGAAASVQFNDTFYAYPMTSDNGYFLYYDSTVVSDPSSLESIIADCEAAGKTVNFELTSGWYQPAFFFGAGCELSYTFSADGSLIGCDVNVASQEGLRALKAMIALEESSSYKNISIANDAQNIGAIVTGTWDSSTLQQVLGEGYAAVKMPTADGFQLSGFGGFKLLGVKPQQTDERAAACEALAMYLSGERAQNERYESVGWGPSNKVVQQSEAVQSNAALSALADQLQYSVPQGQYPGEYWSLAETFGRRLLSGEFSGMSDDELMGVLGEYQAQLTALVQEPIKLRWLMGSYAGEPKDNDMVLEELNRMSRELIGVECEIIYLTEEQMNVFIAAGEDFDIIFTCDWFNNTDMLAQSGILLDISDAIQAAAPRLYASFPESAWELASERDGSLYAVPVLKDYASMSFITYPSVIADELGYELPEEITGWSDLTPFLEAWKATLPENEYPVLIGGAARGIENSFDFVDRTAMIGCLYGSDEIVTMFDDPAIMERYRTLADWYQKGLINPDAPSTPETSIDTSKEHITMVQAWPGYDYSTSNGYPTRMTLYAGPTMNSETVRGAMNGLSYQLEWDDERRDAALKYLELCTSNQKFMDTMRYGVEGYHWNYVTPDQYDACFGGVLRTQAGSEGYTPWIFTQPGYFRTSMLVSQDQAEGTLTEPVMNQYEMFYDAVHENGVASALGRFKWNSSGWEDELAEISAIKDEYYSGFATGAVSIDAVHDEFMAKLNAAGLQDIIADAQAQLDAYLGK